MEIRPVNMDDAAEHASFYSIMRAAELHERVDVPIWSSRECRIMFSADDPSEEMRAYLGYVDGEPVAAGFTALSLLDNTDIAFLISAVAPPQRRRGFGGLMLDRLVEIAVAGGRTVLLTEAWIPIEDREDHPYRRFAEKHGYCLANVEIHRMLELPVPEEVLTSAVEGARKHHDGYTLELYVDHIPDVLLPSLCAVQNQLTLDAPTGDVVLEEEAGTPDVFRERRLILKRQGRTVYSALGLDAQGEVVAFSDLVTSEDQPEMVSQWGTLVHRAHRGHRLGTAAKAANLRAVQRAHPQGRLVSTCNAETNGPMVDINEAMGFRPIELLAEFQRKVEPQPADTVSAAG